MARVKFQYEQRSTLLGITTQCFVILTVIKHISTNTTVHNNTINYYFNNGLSTIQNNSLTSSTQANTKTLTSNSLPNINQTVVEELLDVRNDKTMTPSGDVSIHYSSTPETLTDELEDGYIITESQNESSFTYVYTTRDPIYDYEEMSTTSDNDIVNENATDNSTYLLNIRNESLENAKGTNETDMNQMFVQNTKISESAENVSETTTLKSSTKHGDRSSKVFEDINNEILFQFWTTLSGFSKNAKTTIQVMDETESRRKDETIPPLRLGNTTPSTLKSGLSKITTNTSEVSYDVPSPDNDLAKNSEDSDLDQHNKRDFITTEQTIDPFYTISSKEVTDNKTKLDMNFMEAADYGMMKMNELYGVQEPKLYHMGLVLERDDPARFVAAFNWQSEEARNLSKFGYASLQAYMFLHDKFPDELESRASAEQDEEESESEHVLPRPPRPTPPRTSSLRQQCPLKSEPRCTPASKRYRTHDGTCNNLRRLRWGSALSAVQRFLPPEYGDGVQSIRRSRSGAPLPSARAVSEAVHTPRNEQDVMEAPVTHMLMQWGQFLDHDITSSSQARSFNGSIPRCCESGGREFISSEFLHPECLPISVPEDDGFYAPRGIRCLEFVRSSPAPRSGCEFGYREQLNQVTAYIDGSPVYSSSVKQSDKLRLFRNGLLQYGRVQARRPVLPPDVDDEEALCRGGALDASCFKAGDGRVNEHPGLVAMHIVWLRKHNRLATELSHINPHWSDEKIYQETRKIIGAFIQHITYREFLPIILGPEVMRLFELQLQEKGYYKGYSPKVNPSPANSFGAAAFRFGHSLVQDTFLRYDRFHRPIHNSVSLHKELTNPSNIWSFGAVDRLLLGLMNQRSQKRDEFISPELTNHLFQTSRFTFGMDLASINIQRGRDHGIPPYVQWREPCGLSSIVEWEDLLKIMPLRAVRNLENVYRHVEDIDLFTGGMAERPVIGGLVGPTFACIIAQQFSNLRKGDRFWYENGEFESSFTPAQLQQIRKITLAQVLCQTMENVETLQPFAFLVPDDFRNERISCNRDIMSNFDLSPWTEGNINFDNDISNSDKITKFKFTTTANKNPQNINGLLSDSFTDANQKTTTKNKKPTTHKPINIDDKLDIPAHGRPINNLNDSDFQNKHSEPDTTEHTFTKHTARTKFTTKTSIILNDKLDFLGKKNKNTLHKSIHSVNETSKRSLLANDSTNNMNDTDGHHLLTATDSNGTKPDLELKTFSLTDKMPFFNLLTGLMSTPMPKKPTRKPQVIVYQQSVSTTKKPHKYTYLINIVPKPTTSKYDSKEVVKITVQSDIARPLPNRRPVFNNNKLEYIPLDYSDSDSNSYSGQQTNTRPLRPQHNRPSHYNIADKYDTDPSNTYRPVPTYLGSDVPLNSNQVSTQHGGYEISNFNNPETTTKRYDIFNRPLYDYSSHNYQQQDISYSKPTRPSQLHDSNFNVKPNPNNYQTVKPTTGITIYIDNKVQVKPEYQDDKLSNTYGSQSSEEADSIPLFTRPNYNRPLLQKPLTDYYNPSSDNDQNSNYNNNDHFMTWTHRPDPPHDSFDSYYSSHTPSHKEKPHSISRKPSRPYVTPRPSHVSLHLASEYGNHQPNNISIVINPLLDYKSTSISRTTPPTTIRPSTKYYYIRNVLYKFPPTANESISSKIMNSSKEITNRKHEIIKENYNNPGNPHFHSLTSISSSKKKKNCSSNSRLSKECILQDIIKSKSNISPSVLGLEPKEIDEELLNLPASSRQDSPTKTEKDNSINKVFFDVIPSENSPIRWLYYKEKPENNSVRFIMPQLASDPLASKELPRPINLAKFSNIMVHNNNMKKRT